MEADNQLAQCESGVATVHLISVDVLTVQSLAPQCQLPDQRSRRSLMRPSPSLARAKGRASLARAWRTLPQEMSVAAILFELDRCTATLPPTTPLCARPFARAGFGCGPSIPLPLRALPGRCCGGDTVRQAFSSELPTHSVNRTATVARQSPHVDSIQAPARHV